jgi:8-oxo-dGTP pyrophosphatase MutT (NUDIX family)
VPHWIERLTSRIQRADTRPPDDGRRRAAVAIVLHAETGGPRVLLMKRTERASDPWSGHISLPGGGFSPADGDLEATAIRETREELGLELAGARILGNLTTLSPMTSGPNGIEVTPFVFVTEVALEPELGPEAAAAFWLPLELAASGALDDTYVYPGTDRKFPSWRFDDHVIWGLTWRILADLVTLVGLATK